MLRETGWAATNFKGPNGGCFLGDKSRGIPSRRGHTRNARNQVSHYANHSVTECNVNFTGTKTQLTRQLIFTGEDNWFAQRTKIGFPNIWARRETSIKKIKNSSMLDGQRDTPLFASWTLPRLLESLLDFTGAWLPLPIQHTWLFR